MTNYSAENFEIKGSLKSVIGKLMLVVFGFLFAVPITVFVFKSCNFFECGIGQVLLLISIFFAVFIFWVKSYKITFQNNRLSYKSVFTKETSIELSEIKRAKYQSGGANYYEEKFNLYPKIILYPSAKGKNGSAEITLNIFQENDLQKFYELMDSINKLPFKRNDGKK